MSTSIVESATKAVKDTWGTLVLDVERAIERVTRIAQPSLLDLRTIIKSDVLPLIKATSSNLLLLRDEVYRALAAHADHLDDIEERLEMLDEVTRETQLTPEDAELILNLAGGAKILCGELKDKAYGPAKEKIEELIAMATAAEKMAMDKRIELEDEDEDEEEGEYETEEGETSDDDDDAGAAKDPAGDVS